MTIHEALERFSAYLDYFDHIGMLDEKEYKELVDIEKTFYKYVKEKDN